MVAPTQSASDHLLKKPRTSLFSDDQRVCFGQRRAIIYPALTRYPGATGTDEGPRKRVIVAAWEILDEWSAEEEEVSLQRG